MNLQESIRRILREDYRILMDDELSNFERLLNLLLSKKFNWFVEIKLHNVTHNKKLRMISPVGEIWVDDLWFSKQIHKLYYNPIDTEGLSLGDIILTPESQEIQDVFRRSFNMITTDSSSSYERLTFSWLVVHPVEREETITESTVSHEDKMVPIITYYIMRNFKHYEKFCHVDVIPPSQSHKRHYYLNQSKIPYEIKVYLLGGPNSIYWPNRDSYITEELLLINDIDNSIRNMFSINVSNFEIINVGSCE